MKKQSFIQGAAILLAAGIISRLLGFVPRIALPRIIGAEGIGLYQMGYPLLIALITLVTGGIQISVAKLIAEAEARQDTLRIKRIFRTALTLVLSMSIPLMLLCIFLAPWVTTHLLTDARVYYTFLWMSPIIVIVSISSVYRGYFQGLSNMLPSAFSQITETVIRTFTVLLFAYFMLPYGVEFAAAGAMAGVLVGEVGGLLIFFIQHVRYKYRSSNQLKKEQSAVLKPLLGIAFPVTGSRLVGSTSYFFESILTVQSLAVAGIATAVATAQYGILQGMVIPIILLPGVLTNSLSVSLIPALSEAASNKNMRLIHLRLHQTTRLALVTGAPFVVFMFILAEPLCMLLYNNAEAGTMLRYMAPFALFIYFQGPLQATLQALDKPGKALLNTFVGAAIKLVLIVLLAAKLKLGIYGVVIAICINAILVSLLHWRSVSKLTGFSMSVTPFTKTFALMIVTGLWLYFVMNTSLYTAPSPVRLLLASASGSAIYIVLLFVSNIVDKHDLARVPWLGRKLSRWIH